MEIKRKLRKAAELGVGMTAIAALVLAGCGGDGGTTAAGGTTTSTIVPFKGMFYNGTVSLHDADGNPVALLDGSGNIVSGVASAVFAADVHYPLVAAVSGTYYNEATGASEVSATPIRGFITDAADAASGVGVTAITEIAVEGLELKLGHFSAASSISAASAVDEIDGAASIIGRDHRTLRSPVFNAATGQTSDPDTLRLAALSLVANSHGIAGMTLADKLRDLAHKFASNQASAPTSIITQGELDDAVSAVSGGASSVEPVDTHVPPVKFTLPASSVGSTIGRHGHAGN